MAVDICNDYSHTHSRSKHICIQTDGDEQVALLYLLRQKI